MKQLLLAGLLSLHAVLCHRIVERVDRAGRQTIEDGPFGGSGGSPWTDGGSLHLAGDISAVSMRSGNVVDAIALKYGDTWGPEHGGGGGSVHQYDINPGAHIIIVQVKTAWLVGKSQRGRSKKAFDKSQKRLLKRDFVY